MNGFGVHFSLSEAEVDHLLGIGDDGKRLHHFRQAVEPAYFAGHQERFVESGRSWDAMHRALSGGKLHGEEGRYPLNHVVLGGTSLYAGDDFIMRLKARNQVHDVARVLPAVTQDDFRRRYQAIDAGDYGSLPSEEDFELTWGCFEAVREFWLRATGEERCVLFTANLQQPLEGPIDER